MATIKNVEIFGGIVFEKGVWEDNHTNPNDIPSCNPENSCDVIQKFIGEAEYSYDEYLRVKRDCLREMENVEDTIEAHASKIRESVSYIKELKLKMDEAFNKYKSSWQQ
jgi:hypothetical protein